jgi:hypothetical protein
VMHHGQIVERGTHRELTGAGRAVRAAVPAAGGRARGGAAGGGARVTLASPRGGG